VLYSLQCVLADMFSSSHCFSLTHKEELFS